MKTKLTIWTITLVLTGSLMISCASKKGNSNSDIKEQGTEKEVSETPEKQSRVSPLATVSQKIGETTVSITYSQPSVKGRKVWGGLVSFGKIWRTGANEATIVSFDKDVMFENGTSTLLAGKYALFTIPNENGEWTIVFNKVADQWGAFDYDESKDVVRIVAKATTTEKQTERMTFTISEKGEISLFWDKLQVSFNVQ